MANEHNFKQFNPFDRWLIYIIAQVANSAWLHFQESETIIDHATMHLLNI